jgi:hypothetical protein
LSHCANNIILADMEVEMNTRHRRKRLYPAIVDANEKVIKELRDVCNSNS